jgi:hypothetical protein
MIRPEKPSKHAGSAHALRGVDPDIPAGRGLPGRRCRQAHRERLLAIAQALATGQTRTNKNK